MENLLSVRQVAFIIKVHPLTIRRYIREQKLKAVKAGGNIRIKESDLEQFTRGFTPREHQHQVARSLQPPKVFTSDDPFLQMEGRGASVEINRQKR